MLTAPMARALETLENAGGGIAERATGKYGLHWQTPQALVNRKLAKWVGSGWGDWDLEITPAGRQALAEWRRENAPEP